METETLSPQLQPTELRGAASILQTCTARRVLTEGRAGTGKTAGELWKIHSWCETYRKLRAAFVRASAIDVKKTVLKTFEEFVLPENSPLTFGQSRLHRTHYTYPETGAFIGIFGLDDPQDLFSSEWDIIYVAEATQTTKDKIDLLSRSLRNFRGPYHQIMLDCNPNGPMHWLNTNSTTAGNSLRMMSSRVAYDTLQDWNMRAVDEDSPTIHRLISVHQDNPEYFDLDNWEWKPRGKEYRRSLADMSGHNRERMLNGLWKAAEGSVYPNYSEELNQWRPLNPPADWPLYFGTDPGFDHPWSNQWFTVAPTNELIVVAEIVTSGMGSPEIVAEIKKLEQARGWTDREITRYGDPQYCFSATAMSKKTIAEQWGELGLNLHPWPRTGDNMDGMVDAVRSKVNDRSLIICDDCPKTIAAVQSWSFARNNDGSVKGAKGKDAYEEEYKDPNDVIRGIVALGPKYHPDKFSFDSNRE
jgi:PBSX family phage terminase large subunit